MVPYPTVPAFGVTRSRFFGGSTGYAEYGKQPSPTRNTRFAARPNQTTTVIATARVLVA